MDHPAADRIHIEQIELHARIGVTEDERSHPQRLIVNLTIWPKRGFDQVQDDISRAVDYAELCRVTREFVEASNFQLIETLASALAAELLRTFPLRTIAVEVRKFVLPNTEYVSATVRRGR